MNTITFLVTCKNEGDVLGKLLERLKRHCTTHPETNVVVLCDECEDALTIKVLDSYKNVDKFVVYQHKLSKDFSEHKNVGNSLCSGEYIFAIDADEMPSDFLLDNLDGVLESNPDVELYWLSRVNILRGLNEVSLARWGWNVCKLEEFKDKTIMESEGSDGYHALLKKFNFIISERRNVELGSPNFNSLLVEHYLPIINWNSGDYQGRLYKNLPHIKWTRPLHEYIDGAACSARLPHQVEYSLIHDKTLERQISQNMFYNSNWSQNDNVRK